MSETREEQAKRLDAYAELCYGDSPVVQANRDAFRAGAEALRGHDPLTGLPPDGPKCRRHGIYKLAVAHYYCEACAKEGRATVGPASVVAEPEPRA